jgi:hypothetical protein
VNAFMISYLSCQTRLPFLFSSSLPKNIIRVPKGSIRKYASFLSSLKTTYKVTQDHPRLQGGIKLQDFVNDLGRKEVLTNKGKMSFKDVVRFVARESKKQSSNASATIIQLYLYSQAELANFFTGHSEVKVFADEDRVFELAVYLTYHCIDFSLDTELAELFDLEIKELGSSSFEREISRRNFLRDYSWNKLGDSEILGSLMHVFKEVSDTDLKFLFAKAVEGSKGPSDVAQMRNTMLTKCRSIDQKCLKSKRSLK